jgi:predicted nucleic-acid-binding Zn-ribbon protein
MMKRVRKIICSIVGHTLIVLTRIDNGRSQFGHALCQRCGHTEHYQYDIG